MTRSSLPFLLASASLFAALAAGARADAPGRPARITLGESAASVHLVLGAPDALSQYGGPPNSPTETYPASGLAVDFLRGSVEAVTVRRATPPLRPAPARKVKQASVVVERVGGGAVQVSLGEIVKAVHQALGPWDAYVLNGPAGSQTESYFDAGLTIKYEADRVDAMTVASLVGRAGFKAHIVKPRRFRLAAVSVTRRD